MPSAAERALLGAILIDPGVLSDARELLEPEDFETPEHEVLFRVFLALADSDEPVDLVTVTHALDQAGQTHLAGGAAYVASLLDVVPDVDNGAHYARLVREESLRRRFSKTAQKALRDAPKTRVADLVEDLQEGLQTIAEAASKREFADGRTMARQGTVWVTELMKSGRALAGLPSGFRYLDAALSGLQKGSLVVVAARPGMGKTALAANIAKNVALRERNVAFFSAEMGAQEVWWRLVCDVAGVPLEQIRGAQLTRDERTAVLLASSVLADAGIYVDDQSAPTVGEIRARCERLKRSKGLDLVVVDYLQIMGTRGRAENRTQEVSQLSRGLKALAKDLDVPVVALSQLNRSVERRGDDKEPQLSDLRESGSIEQDADVVLFLTRPGYYDPQAPQHRTDAIIAKNRNGAVGRFVLGWLGEFTRFGDLRQQEDR